MLHSALWLVMMGPQNFEKLDRRCHGQKRIVSIQFKSILLLLVSLFTIALCAQRGRS